MLTAIVCILTSEDYHHYYIYITGYNISSKGDCCYAVLVRSFG